MSEGGGGVRRGKNEVLPKVAYCHPEGTRRPRGDVGVQWRAVGLIMGEYDHFLRTSFCPPPRPPLMVVVVVVKAVGDHDPDLQYQTYGHIPSQPPQW